MSYIAAIKDIYIYGTRIRIKAAGLPQGATAVQAAAVPQGGTLGTGATAQKT